MPDSPPAATRPPGPPLYWVNEILAFLIEVVAFVALGWWGSTVDAGVVVRIIAGVGVVAATVVVWGLFAAPKARVRLPVAGVLAVKAVVFLGAALALGAVWHPAAGVVLAVVAFGNAAVAAVARPTVGVAG